MIARLTALLIWNFKDWVRDQAKAQFQTMIVNYREDPDLQNLIVSWTAAILEVQEDLFP